MHKKGKINWNTVITVFGIFIGLALTAFQCVVSFRSDVPLSDATFGFCMAFWGLELGYNTYAYSLKKKNPPPLHFDGVGIVPDKQEDSNSKEENAGMGGCGE